MYVSFDGVIDFKHRKHFYEFLKRMIESGLYDEKTDSWVTDDGPMRETADDPEELVPVLLEEHENPKGVYAVILPDYPLDGISGLIADLEEGTWEGELRGTTDDGEFEGYIVRPSGDWEIIDLEAWAREHGKQLRRTEDDEDWDTEDRITVMESFIENPNPPKNSMKFIMDDDKKVSDITAV